MTVSNWPSWGTEALTAAGGLAAAWLAYIRGAKTAQADVTNSITSGFQRLVDQLQEMHELDRREIARLSAEVAALKTQVILLTDHVGHLEQTVISLGGTPPARPTATTIKTDASDAL